MSKKNAIDESLISMALQAEKILSISNKSVEAINRNIKHGVTKLRDVISSKDFFECIAFLNAQAKASKIERFLNLKLNHEYIESGMGRGDGYSRKEDKYYEYKISTTNKNRKINAIQIRIWQAIDFYILGYIDEEDFSKSVLFKLNHAEMKLECEKFAQATHGTKKANLENKNIELSLRININNDDPYYKYFFEKYHSPELEREVFGDEPR